MGPPKVLFMVP